MELNHDPTDTVKMVELYNECSISHGVIHHSGQHSKYLCAWGEEAQTASRPYEVPQLEGQVVLGHLLHEGHLSQTAYVWSDLYQWLGLQHPIPPCQERGLIPWIRPIYPGGGHTSGVDH